MRISLSTKSGGPTALPIEGTARASEAAFGRTARAIQAGDVAREARAGERLLADGTHRVSNFPERITYDIGSTYHPWAQWLTVLPQ